MKKMSLSTVEQLPTETLSNVFSHISYAELADLRLVSWRFNAVCEGQLAYGLKRAERELSIAVQEITKRLPARSSRRRDHPLHVNLIAAESFSISIRVLKRAMAVRNLKFLHGKFLEVVFEALRRLSDYTPLPGLRAFMDPVKDAYEIATQKVKDHVAPRFDAAGRPASGTPNRFLSEYLPNYAAPSGSQGVASCSGRGHCPCHDALTKEVEALKKHMASMTEQIKDLKNKTQRDAGI